MTKKLNKYEKLQKEKDRACGGREPDELMNDISKLIYRKLKAETKGGMYHYFEVRLALVPSPNNPNRKSPQVYSTEGEF